MQDEGSEDEGSEDESMKDEESKDENSQGEGPKVENSQGEGSEKTQKTMSDKTDKQSNYNTISYPYINNLSEYDPSQYYVNVITFHEKDEFKQVNATTRNQAKITLQGVTSKPSTS